MQKGPCQHRLQTGATGGQEMGNAEVIVLPGAEVMKSSFNGSPGGQTQRSPLFR